LLLTLFWSLFSWLGSAFLIFLIFLLELEAFAEIKGKFTPLVRKNELLMDNYLVWKEKIFTDQLELKLELLPLKDDVFVEVIGFSGKIYTDWGKLIFGKTGEEFNFPDAAFLGIDESFGLIRQGFSKALFLQPWLERTRYPIKFTYLSPAIVDNYYFNLSSQTAKREATLLYEKSIKFFDLRAALTLSDVTKVPYIIGFNGRMLGMLFGFSFSNHYQTLGVGYGIGPMKIAITALFEPDNVTQKLSVQYKFSKIFSSFITLGSNYHEKLVICGMKFNL
jgi:hypothetical protein